MLAPRHAADVLALRLVAGGRRRSVLCRFSGGW
jgi:hypothetical protein